MSRAQLPESFFSVFTGLCWGELDRRQLVLCDLWCGLDRSSFVLPFLLRWNLEPNRVLQGQNREYWLWRCSRGLVVLDAVSRIYDYQLSTVADRSGRRPFHQLTQTIGIFEALGVPLSYEAIYTRLSEDGQRQLIRFFKTSNGAEESDKCETHVLWEARRPSIEIPQPTSLLPLDNDIILQGYGMFLTSFTANWLITLGDGGIRQYTLSRLCGRFDDKLTSTEISDPRIDGEITSLYIVQNLQTKERFIVSGADDGSISIWTMKYVSLELRLADVQIVLVRSSSMRDGSYSSHHCAKSFSYLLTEQDLWADAYYVLLGMGRSP